MHNDPSASLLAVSLASQKVGISLPFLNRIEYVALFRLYLYEYTKFNQKPVPAQYFLSAAFDLGSATRHNGRTYRTLNIGAVKCNCVLVKGISEQGNAYPSRSGRPNILSR